jgi:hypothetical protein
MVVKNNIATSNYSQTLYGFDITVYSGQNPINYPFQITATNNFCTTAQSACTGCCTTNGDPKFTDPSVGDPTSSTLPNLTLRSDSTAIDGGTNLTTAVGTGSSSTFLVVADALYFQDGTWGSDLARNVTFFPDWISIGTVGNVVQISSVDYATNTITLASPMTWSNGASIWLYKKSDGIRVLYGSAPDYGAYEYGNILLAIEGDLNEDGRVDVIDLGILLLNWGSTSRPAADINQDGRVDVIDFGILLSNWG